MSDSITPIVIVGYNRPKSILRLLSSLEKCFYPSNQIPLIISIDHSIEKNEVLDQANRFEWKHGTKEVICQKSNLGLRKHIIKCASLSYEYGSVILLEDDLYVSPGFYYYATRALDFSLNRPYIGGISLYNHQFNVHKGFHFTPIEDGYDNWYLQFASSWGQAWTEEQFTSFLNWYKHKQVIPTSIELPEYVRSWSDKSWLKYYIAYLIQYDKYFIYPKISLTTNFSDKGTHVGSDSTTFQVPFLLSNKTYYTFSDIKDSVSVYNSYFENSNLHKYLGLPKNSLCVDLYGYRNFYPDSYKYILSPKILHFRIEKSFGRKLRPIDLNIIEEVNGEDIFLYDTHTRLKSKVKASFVRELNYFLKDVSHKNSILLTIALTKKRISNKLDQLFHLIKQ